MKKSKNHPPEPEFSRPLPVEKIPPTGTKEILEAKEVERQRLAERFGLPELPNLRAELEVHPARADQTVAVTGKVIADVVQQCVVTLEPLPAHIEQEIDVLFAAPELLETGAGSTDPEEEEAEPIVDGVIDLGELAAQHLGIALDPYPRKPGVAFVEAEYGDSKAPAGPLAQLANWPKKPKDSR